MEIAAPRVVILGAGRMGQHHLAAALRGRHLAPVGFLEPDRDRREALERRCGLQGYPDDGALFDACAPDCAIIAAPDRHHARLADSCRNRAIPTLVEKPLCPDPVSARQLVASFEESGVLLAVGAIERFNPAWRTFAHTILARADLGSLRIVRKGGAPRDPESGVAFDLAVHDLDLLCTWRSTGDTLLPMRTDCEGSTLATDLHVGPVAVELDAAWGDAPPERTWTAICEAGTGHLDLARRTVAWHASSGDVRILPVPPEDPLELEHAAFAAAILHGATPDFPGLSAHLRALDLCQILSGSGRSDTRDAAR